MEDIRETITHNSDYPDEHERLVKVWEQYNKEFFNGELSPPKILLIELQNEVCSIDELKLWGLYRWVNGESIIAVNACMFRLPITDDSPAYDEFKFRIASDTLLHEMVHQQISETNQYDVNERQYRGHGHKFADICNLVGEIREISPVYVNQKPFCYAWPHSAFTNKQIEQEIGDIDDPCERDLAYCTLIALAENGPDDGGPPTGGSSTIRPKLVLAA